MVRKFIRIQRKIRPEKVYMRKDTALDNSLNGYEFEKNDLNAYIMYLKIEESVLRVHHINKIDREVMYDFITNPMFVPREDVFILKMNEAIDSLKLENIKVYKYIRRSDSVC